MTCEISAGSGKPVFWDKAGYLERVGGRDPLAGTPDYEIISVDIAGDVMAHARILNLVWYLSTIQID